jgi:hypothetical protein
MKLREEIRWEREGDEPGYLFDPRQGGVFGLNPTSALVLEGLARELDEEHLAAEMMANFEVGEVAARTDLSAFLDLLMEHDLVEH